MHRKTLICIFLLATFLVPTFAFAQPRPGEWPTFHADNNRSGFTDSPPPMTNQTLWKFNTGGQVGSPTAQGGIVYVGSYDHNLYAFSAQTGGVFWTVETGGIIISKPAVAEGLVVVGSEDHNLYAFNVATGEKRWNFSTGYYVDSDPAIVDGVVYFGSADANIYALNATSGTKLWSYATMGYVESSPAVVNGVVYIGSLDGNIYALTSQAQKPSELSDTIVALAILIIFSLIAAFIILRKWNQSRQKPRSQP